MQILGCGLMVVIVALLAIIWHLTKPEPVQPPDMHDAITEPVQPKEAIHT